MVAARSSLPLAASIYTARGPRGRAGGRQHSPAQMLPPPIPGARSWGTGVAARGGLVAGRWHCPWDHHPVPRGVLRDGDKPSVSCGYLRKFSPIPKPSKSRGGGDGDDGVGGHGLCWERGTQRGCRIRPLPGTAGTEGETALPVGVPPKSPGKRWCPPSPNHSAPWGTPILGHIRPPVGTEIPSPAPPS